jgi:hypothetical protein
MSASLDFLVVVFLIIAALLAILDHLQRTSARRSLIYGVVLGSVALGLFLKGGTLGPSRLAFGGASPLWALALMFIGVIMGMAATYIFNLTSEFSWRDLARPLVVSPLVLLPLIGSLQGANLEPVQLVCFTVLAFQNGFFWQQVLRDAKPSVP